MVEGEFGLDRPGLVAPTVIYRPLIAELPSNVPAYRPTTGKRPGYGRYEIIPPANRSTAAAGANLLSQLVEQLGARAGHRLCAVAADVD